MINQIDPLPSTNTPQAHPLLSLIDVRWFKFPAIVAKKIGANSLVIITDKYSRYIWSYIEDVCIQPNIFTYLSHIFTKYEFCPKQFTGEDSQSLRGFFQKLGTVRSKLKTGIYVKQTNNKIMRDLIETVQKQQVNLAKIRSYYQGVIAHYNCSVNQATQFTPRFLFKSRFYQPARKLQIERVLKQVKQKKKVQSIVVPGQGDNLLQFFIAEEESLQLMKCIEVAPNQQHSKKSEIPQSNEKYQQQTTQSGSSANLGFKPRARIGSYGDSSLTKLQLTDRRESIHIQARKQLRTKQKP